MGAKSSSIRVGVSRASRLEPVEPVGVTRQKSQKPKTTQNTSGDHRQHVCTVPAPPAPMSHRANRQPPRRPQGVSATPIKCIWAGLSILCRPCLTESTATPAYRVNRHPGQVCGVCGSSVSIYLVYLSSVSIYLSNVSSVSSVGWLMGCHGGV